MKKRISFVLLAALMLCLAVTSAAFAETKTVVLKIGSPNMTVNGTTAEIDQGRGTKPAVVNGRTLVPIRAVVKEMGGSIAWDGSLREIVITANNKVIRMYLNDRTAEVKTYSAAKWTKKTLQVAPTSIKGRTMVPLRFVSEELGAQVAWNAVTKQITINFNSVPFSSSKWTGAWETNDGIVVLIQTGSTVVTAYDTANVGKITGTASGRSLNGKWYVDSVDNGTIKMNLSDDGMSFTGSYNIKETGPVPGGGPVTVTQTFEIKGKRS